jgi:hypothetical protein
MEILFLFIIISFFLTLKKFRSHGWKIFVPMVVALVFLIAEYVNILDAMSYLDSHPQLNGPVGWFGTYWPLPFLSAFLVIVGTPIYLALKMRHATKSATPLAKKQENC